jgi:hypothetical protein
MTPWWDPFAVGLLLAAAAFFLGRRVFSRKTAPKSCCGEGSCGVKPALVKKAR